MLISELFYSLQGEGMLTGVPSVFIRTSGCNLRCRWCDTPYASWQPEGEQMTVAQVLGKVADWPLARHVVLTGGEPMVAPGIHELAAGLRETGMHITIETAGTIPPGGIACDLASLSPKLAHSTPDAETAGAAWVQRHEALRFQPQVLAAWLAAVPEFQLKFVVGEVGDVEEVAGLLRTEALSGVLPWRVQLMPEGRSVEELAARSAWVSQVCAERGWRYCQRLHIQLYGNTRGT